MEEPTRLFRKAAFGGFNRDDVINYIESMKREFFDYKTKVEQTVQELNEKLAQLESAEAPAAAAEVQSDPVLNINEATDHLRQVADELCTNLNRFIDRFSLNSPEPEAQESESDDAFSAPDAAEEETDVVTQVLSSLYAPEQEKPVKKEELPARSFIASVLPAYLFED